jgi:cellulose synthase/poly-beta-1,6-N-acetylglucosamine synthase-like glycosyltransferase
MLWSAYLTAAAALLVYGLNCYVMVGLFRRRKRAACRYRESVRRWFDGRVPGIDLPVVTTQIPVFNEYNVVERALAAACRMRWAPGKHEIQILDDSTDETRELVDRTAARLRTEGYDVRVMRRASRTGFKAGALHEGLARARGEVIAVFDADFVPPPDFLVRTVPFLLANPAAGLVQTRWGHLNRRDSVLTRAQAIGIDGHFMIEQAARAWSGLLMNFNGTAGIWRRAAIESAGGWQWDTLTEDMDLSYRAQLAGWSAVYVPDVVVPAELPCDVRAFKSQQFRWAKGSIQTAKKLLPRILRSPLPPFTKLQAVLHLTHYAVHPFMLALALLALPVLLTSEVRMPRAVFALAASLLALSTLAPNALYAAGQRAAYGAWRRRLVWLPAVVMVGVGVAVSNTRAVLEALLGVESGFVRTPKRGDRERKRYASAAPWELPVELAVGAYCLVSFGAYLGAGQYLVGPFLALYAAGFLSVGMLTLVQWVAAADRLGERRRSRWRAQSVPGAPPSR